MSRPTLLFSAVLLALLGALPAAAGDLRAGAGRAEITPPVGTPLGGYGDRKGAPSTGVHDPIMAKALVLDDGETRLALITSDLVGVSPQLAARAAELARFPRERLMVTASHTHSGPGAYGQGAFAAVVLGAYNEAVFERIARGMAKALADAEASLQPAKLAVGQSALSGFMRNRRKARITDPALWLMRVDTAEGKPLAALLNLTAHGTVLAADNRELSGDWMAFTQTFMEREVPGLTALYTNGALGDISPNIPDNSSTFSGARTHGEKGGRAALELYRTLRPAREARLTHRNGALALPRTFSGALLGAGTETALQCFGVNDALLVAVPGEMITQLGLALKEHAGRQGWKYPAVIGLANDHLGYFLTRAEMKKGGYEAGVSFFGEGFGEDLTLALGGLIGGDLAPLRAGIEAMPEEPRREPPRRAARRASAAPLPVIPERPFSRAHRQSARRPGAP